MSYMNYEATDAVELLIGAGADVNHIDIDGWTPLLKICLFYSPMCDAVINVLINAGADVKYHFKDIPGSTPLANLFMTSDAPVTANIVRIFIKAGADVNETNSYGSTPLMHACWIDNINTDILAAFMEGRPNLSLTNIYGDTALKILRKNKNATNDMIRLLSKK